MSDPNYYDGYRGNSPDPNRGFVGDQWYRFGQEARERERRDREELENTRTSGSSLAYGGGGGASSAASGCFSILVVAGIIAAAVAFFNHTESSDNSTAPAAATTSSVTTSEATADTATSTESNIADTSASAASQQFTSPNKPDQSAEEGASTADQGKSPAVFELGAAGASVAALAPNMFCAYAEPSDRARPIALRSDSYVFTPYDSGWSTITPSAGGDPVGYLPNRDIQLGNASGHRTGLHLDGPDC